MKKIYLAGHCLTKGSQIQRTREKEEVTALGHKSYNPMDNKEINDKANLDNNEGLAEKIVRQDMEAIRWADTVIIEPMPEAQGTVTELGIIYGRKDVANQVLDIYHDASKSVAQAAHDISVLCASIQQQKVYPHFEDIRRFPGVTESEDRRSLGINQFVYGTCLALTGGKGFYEWGELLNELK